MASSAKTFVIILGLMLLQTWMTFFCWMFVTKQFQFLLTSIMGIQLHSTHCFLHSIKYQENYVLIVQFIWLPLEAKKWHTSSLKQLYVVLCIFVTLEPLIVKWVIDCRIYTEQHFCCHRKAIRHFVITHSPELPIHTFHGKNKQKT